MNWNQPQCEACWIEQNKTHGDDGVFSIRKPVRVLDAGIEFCAWCGKPTIFGTYIRASPNTVPYPAPDRES